MKIVFVSNFINHYQVPVCEELYRMTGGDLFFVETQELPQSFRKGGFSDYDKPYILRAWRNDEERQRALRLCIDADVLIAGGGKFVIPYEKVRLQYNKLTFEYAERSLKRGWINLFSPTNIKMQLYYHTLFCKKNFYKLCVSAYTARDMYLQHAFVGKCIKYGYFPQIPELDIEDILKKKYQQKHIKIIWCARFIEWKHPEMAVLLAERLHNKGYDFELNMIGSGKLYGKIERMINDKGLSSCVHLLGNYPNEEVLRMMEEHHIFLFTSDRNEGWGVVLNEAMGRGCCPVASHLIGSVPFLLEHNNNGMIFESGNLDSLMENIEFLLCNREDMKSISKQAYKTVKDLWSPKVAAERLMTLLESLKNGETLELYKDGPLSKALPISEKYNIESYNK